MREDSANRYCEVCNADWLDKPIPLESIEHFAHKLPDGTWSDTHFSRRIGIYDMGVDRTVAWKCPDCKDTVGRVKTNGGAG